MTVEMDVAVPKSEVGQHFRPVWQAVGIRLAKRFFSSWFRRVLLVSVLVFAMYTLYRNWHQVWSAVHAMPWQMSAGSLLAAIFGIVVGAIAWRTIVAGLGTRIGALRAAQVNLVGALGKYLPGSVWAYLLQMELGRKVGLPRSRVFTGALVQFGIALVVTVCFAAAGLPLIFPHNSAAFLALPLAPIGLVCLHPRVLTWCTNLVLRIARRKPLDQPLTAASVLKTLCYQVVSYTLFGTHLWIICNAVDQQPDFGGLLMCICAFAVAMNVGVFVFILPSGAGVRDGLLVALLSATMPYSTALALALVSRVMLTVADVTTAGISAGLAHWRSPRSEVAIT